MKAKWMAIAMLAAAVLGCAAPGVVAQSPQAALQGQSWDATPSGLSKTERRGYRDGVEGARKDAENHRTPNVHNRHEYRHPHVSKHKRKQYRKGFREGYEAGMAHLGSGAR